ncbi:DUF4865 domain-containing protein [Capsulimonas corticalis]|uniref:DUF4865 domain-containing protein n=1 Tax=Capsulimonas corticalis TaxID=2219043 RepID=A0A402CTF6_9BACT|nr:DUF4865 family protein [Capsulimonas corticalis]BDI30743.1 DUF4865 domain-containing protein [Capsulimonas corticalis]
MLAMQYSITLPRDYDMGIVRDRVAKRGPSFDGTPHLEFKAFLISEVDMGGARENRYAPFYLWRSEVGTLDFLHDFRFAGLTQDFGWPSVHMWMPMAFRRGEASDAPVTATREAISIAPHSDLAALRAAEMERQEKAIAVPGVYARVVALDPRTWELVRFTLWSGDPQSAIADAAETLQYEVLHLSLGE